MSGSTNDGNATFSEKVALSFFDAIVPLLIATAAFFSVACTLDVADELSFSADGPGLSLDEGFNIETGVLLISQFEQYGLAALDPESLQEIYSHPAYNPDHPPLGRVAMGITNRLGLALDSRLAPDCGYRVGYARLSSAIAFALMTLLVGVYAQHWHGRVAGITSAISFALLPRVFGHAHLASLETWTTLTWAAVLLWVADDWSERTKLKWYRGIIPGIFLGLALLTKMQAIFLPPILGLWAFAHWRFRSLIPLAVTYVVGFAVFFVGWPWLWIDPAEHLKEYFARSADRSVLYCYYFGEKLVDKEVPWHYPFVMMLVTTPLTYTLAALFGSFAKEHEQARPWAFSRRGQLIFAGFFLPLVFFAVPGIANYDGIRLFLIVTPQLAIMVGYGFAQLIEAAGTRNLVAAWIASAIALLFPIYSLISYHPCQLSYYATALGGVAQADHVGLETGYWGSAVTPQLIQNICEEMPADSTLEVAPVLHPLQLEFLRRGTQFRDRPDLQLKAYDDQREDLSPYVLVIRRKADQWTSLTPPPPGTEVLHQVTRQGVVLAEFLKLPTK